MKESNNLLLTVLIGASFLFSAATLPETPQPTVPSITQKAEGLEKDGKYLEAQKVYEEILQDPQLQETEASRIRSHYEDLNMKILLSPVESPESAMHTVSAGENLYLIAKRYKTTVALIKRSNGLKDNKILPGMKLKVITGVFSIRIDKPNNLLALLLNDKVLKHFQVATGAPASITPAGEFKVINKLENPTWFKTGAVIRPGSPKNSLGTRWLGIDSPGYGIHGTIEPESIGKHVTSGCIRMGNEEVEILFDIIPTGTKVTITD